MDKRASFSAKLLFGSTLIGAVVLTLAFTACGSKSVEIGAIVPETGDFKNYGVAIREGIELALAEIQADPNYSLELDVRFADTESEPEKAAEELEAMYKDGIPVVIGGVMSGEALAMVEGVLNRYDRILVSPSASTPRLTGASNSFFRIYPSDFLEASKMALFASQTLNLEEVVIMAETQEYATGIQTVFAQEFERLGGKVVEVVDYPPNTVDFSGLADRVVTLDPPAVYVAGYDAGIAEAIRALKADGYEGKILTTAAFATPTAIALAGDAAVGVLLTKVVFEADSEFAHVQRFVQAYEAKYGKKPDLFAAHGYDAMKLVSEALEGRTLITSEIIKGLRGVKDFPGVTGSIQFDEKGDVKKFPRVYLVSKELTLYNYDEHAAAVREELERRRKELEERLRRIQREAQGIG